MPWFCTYSSVDPVVCCCLFLIMRVRLISALYFFTFHSITNHYIQFMFSNFPRKRNLASRKVTVAPKTARRKTTRTDGQTRKDLRAVSGDAPLHKYSFTFHSITNRYIQFVFKRFLRKQTRPPGKYWSLPGRPDRPLHGLTVKPEDVCSVRQCPTS